MVSKYESHVKPRLKEVEAWARDGVPEQKMAAALGVAWSTFKLYKQKHSALSACLARTKEYVDLVEMVGAYKRRAEGYDTTEYKRTYGFMPDPQTGEIKKVLISEVETVKHIPGDARAMENWLRLRQPEAWGNVVIDDENNGSGVAFIVEKEVLNEPED